jgi:plastocyanin
MSFSAAWISVAASLVIGAGPPAESAPGRIVGVVRYTGAVPPPEKIPTNDGILLHSDLLVQPKSRGLRYVLVCLADAPAQPKLAKARPVLVDQHDLVFTPRVVAARHGQAVSFDNNDHCNHSVMAQSTLAANQFNVFVQPTRPFEYVFEPQKHAVRIECSLHPWMRAWVYVFEHAWFAVSDEHGRFQIERVPPGTHMLWLRHPDSGLHERRPVEVQAGQTVQVDVEWKAVRAP